MHCVWGLLGMAHLLLCLMLFFSSFPSSFLSVILLYNSMGRENNALKMDCAICFLSSCFIFFFIFICRLHLKGRNLFIARIKKKMNMNTRLKYFAIFFLILILMLIYAVPISKLHLVRHSIKLYSKFVK